MSNHFLFRKFMSLFNHYHPRCFFAPGRINLIGEHTDYNGGHVLPGAISLGTYALAVKRHDKICRFYSMNMPETGIVEFHLDDINYKAEHDWANYPKGMLQCFLQAGYEINAGMDILYFANIPNSAGLSSSASIEIVTGVILESLFGLDVNRVDLVKLGQKVENDYIGVHSGIMDQFAIGTGKKDHVICLDTNTMEYSYAPLRLPNHSIMIINTNKRRFLAGSKYNERRGECEQALSDLQMKLTINSLAELTIDQFEKDKHLITNKTNQKRAKHVIYENARTLQAFKKLKNNDLTSFGQLMNESHLSLQHDYEVTGVELDTIVESAWNQPGVIGARMTGFGFGGCAIAIVAKDKIKDFKQQVRQDYIKKVDHDVTFYTASIDEGAKELIKEVI